MIRGVATPPAPAFAARLRAAAARIAASHARSRPDASADWHDAAKLWPGFGERP